jgi:iodotyrosine deiodinase
MKEKKINGHDHTLYNHFQFKEKEMIERSEEFYEWMDQRRTVREFSSQDFDISIIENIIKTASTAPSGAHKQPWTFCVVKHPAIKKRIREAAEKEEKEGYDGRMGNEWLEDLQPLGTNWEKPFLENAPYLIIVFKRVYEFEGDGHKHQNYYVQESIGIACGFLLAAIHEAGLVALTHTPSPMNFLSEILNRPENERPFLLIPVGKPVETYVPKLSRKQIEDVMVVYK